MCQNTTMRVYRAWIKDIAFYVQKHITPCTVVITSLLVHDKPLGAPAYVKRVYWTPTNKLQWDFNQNIKHFIYENASENIVCEKVAILSRGRWVNKQEKISGIALLKLMGDPLRPRLLSWISQFGQRIEYSYFLLSPKAPDYRHFQWLKLLWQNWSS